MQGGAVPGAMPSEARVAPGTRQEVGILTWAITGTLGWITGLERPKLFLILARHRPLYRGWLLFARQLMPGGRLPRRETELVILRVAHLRDCEYERRHHEHLSLRAGISPATVAAIGDDPATGERSERERVILASVDALVAHHDLDDAEWAALHAHLDDREVIELCMLVGHYEMLATLIQALRIAPDEQLRPPLRRRLTRR